MPPILTRPSATSNQEYPSAPGECVFLCGSRWFGNSYTRTYLHLKRTIFQFDIRYSNDVPAINWSICDTWYWVPTQVLRKNLRFGELWFLGRKFNQRCATDETESWLAGTWVEKATQRNLVGPDLRMMGLVAIIHKGVLTPTRIYPGNFWAGSGNRCWLHASSLEFKKTIFEHMN